MINIPITKILFLDIETVGISEDYDTCESNNPEIAEQFSKYFDWFQKRFPEDEVLTNRPELANFMFRRRSALVPEFAKIVCVSFSFVTDKGDIKSQTFSGYNEKKILLDSQTLLERCGKLGFYLCGHNLK